MGQLPRYYHAETVGMHDVPSVSCEALVPQDS